jgi:hypothetical protein
MAALAPWIRDVTAYISEPERGSQVYAVKQPAVARVSVRALTWQAGGAVVLSAKPVGFISRSNSI